MTPPNISNSPNKTNPEKPRLLLVGVYLLFICVTFVWADRRPEVGTRAIGLGGAFVSSANDPTGVLWNPAGLAELQAGEGVYDLSQGAFLIAYPLPPIGTFGLGVLDLNEVDRFVTNHHNNPIGTFETTYNQAVFSYARSIGRLQIGANVGYNRVSYHGSRWEPNFDVGVVAEISPRLLMGAKLGDISDVTLVDADGDILRTFDQQLDLGVTWKPIPYLHLNNALDTTSWEMGSGAEVTARGVSLRLGSVIDINDLNRQPSWSVGFSLDRWHKQIHYAYLSQSERDYKHFLSVGFTFGGPNQTESRPAVHMSDVAQIDVPIRPENEVAIDAEDTLSGTAFEIASQHGVEIELLLALVKVESAFHPDAISGSGAVGLTQLMPPTARDLGLKVPAYRDPRKPRLDSNVDERFHPRKNLEAGARYLKMMLDRYDGNYALAIAAYNSGPGTVEDDIPTVRQTERHVGKVLNRYYQYKAKPALQMADLRKLDALMK